MKALTTKLIPQIFTIHSKLTPFAHNYVNPDVKTLHSIKGTNVPISSTYRVAVLTFGNCLLSECITINRTSKLLFGGIKVVLIFP